MGRKRKFVHVELVVMSAESNLSSAVTSDLTNVKNIADEIPADPKIMHITII